MSDELNQNQKSIFGITTETKEKNNAPILVPSKVTPNAMFPAGWKFPVARLVNVVSNPSFEKKNGDVVPVLQFVFRDKEGRQYTHMEWKQDPTDEKFQTKLEGLNVRIKHIYTAIFGAFPEKGIGTTAKNFAEFFNAVASAFNKVVTGEGETAKRAYTNVDLFIKLIYYKKNLGFPLSPNFLEKVIPNQPCKLLTVNLSYDKLEPSSGGGGGIPGMGDAPNSDDLPSFDAEYV